MSKDIDEILLGSVVELRERRLGGPWRSLGMVKVCEVGDEGVRYNGGRVLVTEGGKIYSAIHTGETRELVDHRTEGELLAASLGAAAFKHLHGRDGVLVKPHDGRGGLAFTITAPAPATCLVPPSDAESMSLDELAREAAVLGPRVGIDVEGTSTVRGAMRALVEALRELDAE